MIFDTIVAKTTSNGVSAVNVIRVSGDEAFPIVNRIFKGSNLEKAPSHTIKYGFIHDQGKTIDEVMVFLYRSPKSFTAEDVIEISTHGGNFIANEVIKLLIKNGARLADNGEFTKRAYLNGRLDLTEAESIMDMVNAKTFTQLSLANKQLRNRFLLEKGFQGWMLLPPTRLAVHSRVPRVATWERPTGGSASVEKLLLHS